MAGHSKFKNIMYRKGAQDAKRGKVFTRIIAFASSVLLLIPPLEIVYGYSGFLLNSIGLLLLIAVYFIQGRFKVWSSA